MPSITGSAAFLELSGVLQNCHATVPGKRGILSPGSHGSHWEVQVRRGRRKALIARADARASELAPIVAELRRSGITSWYGIARELNRRGVPTATGRGIWEPGQVRRVMERLK